jgi:hypothetical protein
VPLLLALMDFVFNLQRGAKELAILWSAERLR